MTGAGPDEPAEQRDEQAVPEPVPGSTRTVREVAALPDGRRITWYASAPGE